MKTNNVQNVSFNGLTRIYALADTHQDTRKTASFLSQIINETKNKKDTLFLHAGDMFQGLYPRELEADCYVKMKEANPFTEMVITLGNNDFGFNRDGYNFFIKAVKNFVQKGIRVVSANVFDISGRRPVWLLPYVVVERDGDRNFVTGFCTHELHSQGKGFITSKPQFDVLDELKADIEREKPDNIIILNHDFKPSGEKIINYFKSKGINVDLTIEGHDHARIMPDEQLHIYHPEVYANTMYSMSLINKNGQKQLTDIVQRENRDVKNTFLNGIYREPIERFEKETNLFGTISKRVLDLSFAYSEPCTYGTFFADSIKEAAGADIGFVSTGFLREALSYKKGGNITNYDLLHSMPTKTPVKTVELTGEELKEVFDHAFKTYKSIIPNARFLQCSSNLKIALNGKDGDFEVKQIFIDGKPVLNQKNSDKKYKCALDTYIAGGGQKFVMLENKNSEDLYINDELSNIGEVLKKSLADAQYKYQEGYEYPNFKIETN